MGALLYGLGVPGEIAAPVGLFGAGALGAAAKWARDVKADRASKNLPPSLWVALLSALGTMLLVFWVSFGLVVLSGCALAAKIGPGPYGWATVEYDIARTANLEATLSPPMICIGCYDDGTRLGEDPNAPAITPEE